MFGEPRAQYKHIIRTCTSVDFEQFSNILKFKQNLMFLTL